MRSGSVKHDPMAQDAVDQEPVRIYMALGEPGEIPFERMFSENLGQRLASLKQCENVFERLVIESEPGKFSLQTAEITFKTPRENDLLHSRLRYATASRAVLKRRTLPSRSSRRDWSSARRAAAFNS